MGKELSPATIKENEKPQVKRGGLGTGKVKPRTALRLGEQLFLVGRFGLQYGGVGNVGKLVLLFSELHVSCCEKESFSLQNSL